jgi:hypothetical protein
MHFHSHMALCDMRSMRLAGAAENFEPRATDKATDSPSLAPGLRVD